MSKLKLNLAHEAGEILSKEEMKNVLGGAGSSIDYCPSNRSLIVCRITNSNNEVVEQQWVSTNCASSTILRYCDPDKIVSAYCMCEETGS